MKPFLQQFLKEDVNFDTTFVVNYYKDGKYIKSVPIFIKKNIKDALTYACKMFGLDQASLKENDKHSPYIYIYENDNTRLIINAIEGKWKKD